MENSEFLKPSQNPPITIPPHVRRCRRPIQSQTCRILLNILSHCNALQSSSHPPIPDENDGDKLREGTEKDAFADRSCMESEISLVKRKPPDGESKEICGFQDAGNDTLNEVDRLDPMDISKQGNVVLAQDNNVNLVDSSVVENQICDSVIHNIAGEKDTCSVVDFHQELSLRREQKVFSEPFVNEVPGTASSTVNMDVIVDMSKPAESCNAKSPAMEEHLSERLEDELQLKQKELEKLISTSGNLGLPPCETEDGEIEEGEISGEIDDIMDLLFEDAVSSEEKLEKVQVSEHADTEVFTCDDGDVRLGKCDTGNSTFPEAVDNSNDIMELETKSTRKEQHACAEVFVHREDIAAKSVGDDDTFLETECNAEQQVSGVNKTDHPAISLENLAQHGLMHEETTKDKGYVDAEMEASVGKKKRGPLTKERRAKKKQKERIKRAEKNRKLGVKRLKIQPMLKPKTVTYCRHYLNGRCQEGEKCKFSHDTIPLTKSKPCSYFARHSCMKGDNCPFDHQLSKYPCNNVVTKGFCSRGAGCLFSHEISSKDDSLPTSNVSKPEFKSPSLRSEPNSKKQVNNQGIPHQQVDTKFSTMENFSGKNTEKKVPERLETPAAHIPKGICLISHVRSPPSNTNKHGHAAPHLKGEDSEKVSSSITNNLPDSIQKSIDVAKGGVPSKTPRGINFLSFGKRPLDVSLNRDSGVSESLLGQFSKSKLADSPSNDNQTGQSSSELEPKVNEIANTISPFTSQGMKFLSFGKAPVDNPTAVSQAALLPYNVNMGLPWVQEKKNALEGLKVSCAMPHRLASSSQPFCQSLDQSGAGNFGGLSSSSKTSLLSNTRTSVHKALQSTLAFASKLDSGIKLNHTLCTPSDMNKHDSSTFRG